MVRTPTNRVYTANILNLITISSGSTPPQLTSNLPVGTDSNPAWHTLTIERTLAQIETDDKTGLTESQVIDRQQEFGANELVAPPLPH